MRGGDHIYIYIYILIYIYIYILGAGVGCKRVQSRLSVFLSLRV